MSFTKPFGGQHGLQLALAAVIAISPNFISGESNTVLLATVGARRSLGSASTEDLDGVTQYDYIVIGGGTAGYVLAADSPKIKISINGLIYNTGSPDDFDEWERLGNSGWGASVMQGYSKKAEFLTPSPTDPQTRAFLESCVAGGIPKVLDFNSFIGNVGAGVFQRFIDQRGHRSSSASAYVGPEVAARPNLKIAVGQTVTKIIHDLSGYEPRAVGIEMTTSSASPGRYLAKARQEVIVSAGAVQTPHILKPSGVGPATELKQHGIPIVNDLPGVGAKLADHLHVPLVFKTKMHSLQCLLSPLKSLPALIEWLRFGTGVMTTNVGETACFLRSTDRPDAPTRLGERDNTSGTMSSDLEIIFGPVSFIDHGLRHAPVDQDWGSVCPTVLRPSSRGSITLVDTSPFTRPRIIANYLSTEYDRDIFAYGLRIAIDIVRAPPLSDSFDGWYAPHFDVPDKPMDEQLLAHVRKNGHMV